MSRSSTKSLNSVEIVNYMEKRNAKVSGNGQCASKPTVSRKPAGNNDAKLQNSLNPTKTDSPILENGKSSTTTTTNEANLTNGNRSKKCKGLVNLDYCSYCDEGGDLLNCDRCPASFHLMCQEPPLSSDQIPKGEFLCNKCKSKAKLLVVEQSVEKKSQQNDIFSELNLPISNDVKTIKFEMEEDESPLETLIRMAKSLNPRQMQLSTELSMECAFDMPGLNKIKWWSKDGNRIVSSNAQKNDSASLSHSSGPNGLFNGHGGSSNSLSTLFLSSNSNSDGSQTHDTSQNKFKNLKTLNHVESCANQHQNETCFICLKNGKEGQLARCDFCALKYHLDCLNPPLCSMPPRDRLWMCPNHVENFLDQNVLATSRLTERINLWNKYSLSGANLNSVKIDFIKKCNRLRNAEENGGTREDSPSQVHRCNVPDAVKYSYKKLKNESLDFVVEKDKEEEADIELKETENIQIKIETNSGGEKVIDRKFSDENEKESYLSAVEALQLLSKSSNLEAKSSVKVEEGGERGARAPPLDKHCKEAIRPRAFLQPVPSEMLNYTNKKNFLAEICKSIRFYYMRTKSEAAPPKLSAPFHMTYRSITIGAASNMNVCLNLQPGGKFDPRSNACQFVSEKHACIYYDEQTNNYELLNYSEHGTIVDNCIYGLDFEIESEADDENNSDSDDSNKERSLEWVAMSARTSNNFSKKCKCKMDEEEEELICKYWEGPAILMHGSHLKFGCLNFIFVIVDYDFISAENLENPVEISSKRFLFESRKRKNLGSSVIGVRKDVIKLTLGDYASSQNTNNKKSIRLKKVKQSKTLMKKKSSVNKQKTSLNGLKIDKIEAFINLMNNQNKKNLLSFS